MKTDIDATIRARLESVNDGLIELSLPGTEYRLHLVPANGSQITVATGKHIRGIIEARALKVHTARGGGKFIEPVYGSPRIVAGMVEVIDIESNRLLVDVAVSMWVDLLDNQPAGDFNVGDFVTFYVSSGATFTIVE